MINVLVTIWALIGIIVGGGILLTMATTIIGFVVAAIVGIVKGIKKK